MYAFVALDEHHSNFSVMNLSLSGQLAGCAEDTLNGRRRSRI